MKAFRRAGNLHPRCVPGSLKRRKTYLNAFKRRPNMNLRKREKRLRRKKRLNRPKMSIPKQRKKNLIKRMKLSMLKRSN